MRRWWTASLVLIVGLVVMIVVSCPSRRHDSSVAVQILRTTNDASGQSYSVIQISNTTERLHGCKAWSEYSTNGLWFRDSLTNLAVVDLAGHCSHTFVVGRTGKAQRVTVLCSKYTSGQAEYWMSSARAWLGKNPFPDVYKLSVRLD